MAEEAKRYIVTFKKDQVEPPEAAEILKRAPEDVLDGVAVMATDKHVEEGDCDHFKGIGSTCLVLAEKEIEDLNRDDRVEEVVEDIEVEMFGADSDTYEAGYQQALADMCGLRDDEGDDSGGYYDGYEAGYMQAIADLHGGGARRCRFPGTPSRRPLPRGSEPASPLPPPPLSDDKITWNIKLVKADQVWKRVTGVGVKVAVIDTGIDDNHPDLTVSGGASFVDGVSSWDDDKGHGTHCAGIVGALNNDVGVVGVAPDCSLYAVKVLGGNGRGHMSWILAAMGWAVQQGMDVASMSLGSAATSADMRSIAAYQRAAEQLKNAGCIVVAAAGNSGKGLSPWVGQPARCPTHGCRSRG